MPAIASTSPDDMHIDDQLVALAQLDGWRNCEICRPPATRAEPNPRSFCRGMPPGHGLLHQLKQYTADLNATNSVETQVCGVLMNPGVFLDQLVLVVARDKRCTHTNPRKALEAIGVFPVISASAAQRSEALLRATKKWKGKCFRFRAAVPGTCRFRAHKDR